MKVLFLDRDGIINRERGDYTWKKKDFQFTDNLFQFLGRCQKAGFAFIVITNQGGIDKGLYTNKEVEDLHQWMKEVFEQRGTPLVDVYYCPHHDQLQKCLCRKPGSLMVEKALATFSIDSDTSLMIGDRQRDVQAALNAGIRGILIDSNPDWKSIEVPN
ncbi:MAG: HAD family hydrolase [Vicingaceae bacterium]